MRLSFSLPFYHRHSDKHLFPQNQEFFRDRKRALCSLKSRARIMKLTRELKMYAGSNILYRTRGTLKRNLRIHMSARSLIENLRSL